MEGWWKEREGKGRGELGRGLQGRRGREKLEDLRNLMQKHHESVLVLRDLLEKFAHLVTGLSLV